MNFTFEGKIFMANAIDVAKYLLSLVDTDADEGMSNMKLQKLLYYCQGFHLAMTGKRLFSEDIYAWLHGPVVPEVWHEYNQYGANVIPYPQGVDFSKIDAKEKSIIDDVYSLYGQYSAWGLRNMTHDESPWKETPRDCPIDDRKMVAFFKTQLD